MRSPAIELRSEVAVKPTVLVAESDSEVSNVYRAFLGDRGYETIAAASGLECIDLLRRQTPDVLVLDLELPWGGGDGVVKMMRDCPRLRSIPVILVRPETINRYVETLRDVRTLAKPFPLMEFLDCVEDAISQRQRRSPGLLVVDDDPQLRAMLKCRFEQDGITTHLASDGDEALDYVCRNGETIGAILLDVQMPSMDGPKTLEGIREIVPDVPVCFMSGDTGKYEVAALLGFGARQVLSKPFCLDEATRLVRELIEETTNRWAKESL